MTQVDTQRDPGRETARRIWFEWHRRAKACDVDGLLELYAQDALFESPLVPRLLDTASGVLRGHEELRPFLRKGADARPNQLVRWYRPEEFFWDGRTLVWEYPRESPDGDQLGLVEIMDIVDGLIQRHRIYWGWVGTEMLIDNAIAKVR
ncbi:MAG: nuclear transport factor 2 family protein [Kutzneria sp.]|nr:nuclear transport factor 2 family protein [Kutzneria sp.]MBV9846127.1 nuclear transport factor 2 family protein [Kutzneria sp.]